MVETAMGNTPAELAVEPRFFLRTAWFRTFLQRRHLRQEDFAKKLGLSRSYWSQILNRRRHLTVGVRQALLDCPLLAGVPERRMWEEVRVEEVR